MFRGVLVESNLPKLFWRGRFPQGNDTTLQSEVGCLGEIMDAISSDTQQSGLDVAALLV